MTEREEEPDLNELNDAELEREKKREFLRGSREERKRRHARAGHEITRDKIEDGIKVAFAAGLLIMICGAVAALVVGLARGDAKVITGALVVLGILGRVIYKLLQGQKEDQR